MSTVRPSLPPMGDNQVLPPGSAFANNQDSLPDFVRSAIACKLAGIDRKKLSRWVAAKRVRTIEDIVHDLDTTLYCVADLIQQKFHTDEGIRAEWDVWDEAQLERYNDEVATHIAEKCEAEEAERKSKLGPFIYHVGEISLKSQATADRLDGTSVSLLAVHRAIRRGNFINQYKAAENVVNRYVSEIAGNRKVLHAALDLILDTLPKETASFSAPDGDFPIDFDMGLTDLHVLALLAKVRFAHSQLSNPDTLGCFDSRTAEKEAASP